MLRIEGVIEFPRGGMTVSEFNDRFIKWVNSQGWYFGGIVRALKEDEK